MSLTNLIKMASNNPEKYPARMGQAWSDEEVSKLLAAIQKKTPIEEIAKNHERTVGGINSHRRQLAYEYYTYDKRSMEEISKFTGLTHDEITYAIESRLAKEKQRENKKQSKAKSVKAESLTVSQFSDPELKTLLIEINRKLDIIMSKIE